MSIYHGREAAKEALKKSKQRQRMGGHFLQLKDGDYVIVAFLGEPMVREVIWENGKTRTLTEQDRKEDKKGSVRFALNIWVREFCPNGGEPQTVNKLQIIEQGTTWYEKIVEHEEEEHGIYNNWFKIKRKGSGRDDTKYSVHLKAELTSEEKEDLKNIELFDLEKKLSRSGDDNEEDEEEEIISEKIANTIKKNLSNIPREEITAFMKRFKTAKIKDIKERNKDVALELSEELKNKFSANEEEEEKDPFED